MSEKIVLKNVRLSYEHLFRADAIAEGNEPKYSATWIIPKGSPQVSAVKKAIDKALDDKFPGKRKPGAPWPSTMHNPLRTATSWPTSTRSTLAAGCCAAPRKIARWSWDAGRRP